MIAVLLVLGGAVLGFQAAQWKLASWYTDQVAEVRRGYDEATKQRDARLSSLAAKTTDAAAKVEAASATATQAADAASKAVDKATEAADRVKQ